MSTPILSTRCTLPGRSLWFGRADLFRDRIRLTGWTWQGQFERVLPLERVEDLQWWAVTEDVNLLLDVRGGREVPLQLHRDAGTWNYTLRDLLGLEKLPQTTGLPEPPESTSSRRRAA